MVQTDVLSDLVVTSMYDHAMTEIRDKDGGQNVETLMGLGLKSPRKVLLTSV